MNIVKELRKKAGIQQKELAIICGVSRPTVSEWESNKKDPSGERLKKLSEYFGVDELVILGKNVVMMNDYYNSVYIPQTEETRILAPGMDKMPKEQREMLVNMAKLMFKEYFEGSTDQHDNTEL